MKNLLFLSICLFLAIPSQAEIIIVDDDGPADFDNIQAAINDANDDDIVVVFPGTYTGPGNRDIDFLGKAITVRSVAPDDPYIVAATVIDCNGTQTEHHRGFYFHSGEDANCILDGLRITNGYVSGVWPDPDCRGAGISCENNSGPTINNCIITGNSATYGGGIFGCKGPISNCVINDNWANNQYGGVGLCDGPVVGCTISNNIGNRDTGGIGGCAAVVNCVITGNSARLQDSGGLGGCGNIINCVISGNSAGADAGAMGSCYGVVANCIITGNSASKNGGALRHFDGVIINCTIVGNFAGQNGGAAYGCNGLISSSIISDNRSADASALTSSVVPMYSYVQNASSGIGCISSDPCFVGPGYWDPNGTPSDASDDFWVDGDYHLRPDSPCIDGGNYAYCMSLPSTDYDGGTRLLGYQIDMGCCEFGSTIDADGDWLADSCEPTYAHDPDRDDDGILDGLELLRGTDPNVVDPLRQWNVPNDANTIQKALFLSRSGETIVLSESTYYENIYLGGRNIILTSTDPNDPTVVAATVINGDTDANSQTPNGRVVTFVGTEDANCQLRGLTITGGRVSNVYGHGGGISSGKILYPIWLVPHASIINCIISSNAAYYGGVLYRCDGLITNCTISGNSASKKGGAFYGCHGQISNCIIWDNSAPAFYASATPTYSCVQGGSSGLGCISSDPCFVEPGHWDGNGVWIDGDYHLKSQGWYWHAGRKVWTWDEEVTSRCIDAGNPGSPLGEELLTIPEDPDNDWGENLRINMGAYGGTAEASMPPYDWSLLSDITNDGTVDFVDFAHLADIYLEQDERLPADFDRDGDVNYPDLRLLTEDWLKQTAWYE